MPVKPGPLNWQIPIVNKNGTPTDEFHRWLQNQLVSNGSIPALDTPEEVSAVLDYIGGNPGDLLARGPSLWSALPSPGDVNQVLRGDLTWGTPAGSDIQALLDGISSTQGTLLYRSGSAWSALAPGLAGRLLQTNGTGANPTWVAPVTANIQTLLDTISTTQGTILYRGVGGWAALSPGTSGNVLTTQGTGADPVWASGGGGGGGGSMYSPCALGDLGLSQDTYAGATKGMLYRSFATVSFEEISLALWAYTNGAQYTAGIYGVTSGSITSVIATSPPVTWNTGDPAQIVMPFSAPVVVPAGVYAIGISWSNAGSDTTVLPVFFNENTLPNWPGLPIITRDDGLYGAFALPKRVPVVTDSLVNAASFSYYCVAKWKQ